MPAGTLTNCPNCAAPCSAAAAACSACGFPIASLPDPPPFPVHPEYLGGIQWQPLVQPTDQPEKNRRAALIAAIVAGVVLLLLLIAAGLYMLITGEARNGGSPGDGSPDRTTTSQPTRPSTSGSPSASPTQTLSPGASPSRSPSSGPFTPRPGGPGQPSPTRSPDIVAARAAQALNAGDQAAFEGLSLDSVVGESTYSSMIATFGRPGWESGECDVIGPLFACRMFHSGDPAGALVLNGTEPDVPILAWSGPGG